MHHDVIEIPKGVLQSFQARHKLLSTLVRKSACKKLRSIPEFLALYSQAMPSLWIKLVQALAPLEKLFPSALQLLRRCVCDRLLPKCAGRNIWIVDPISSLNPRCRVKNELSKARTFDRPKGSHDSILASLPKIP